MAPRLEFIRLNFSFFVYFLTYIPFLGEAISSSLIVGYQVELLKHLSGKNKIESEFQILMGNPVIRTSFENTA